jgi:hypothetical protein
VVIQDDGGYVGVAVGLGGYGGKEWSHSRQIQRERK